MDNIYVVIVQASDGTLTDTQTINVTVLDLPDTINNYRLQALAGSFAWTGEIMTPIIEYTLNAGAGGFALTGATIALRRSYTMAALVGTVAVADTGTTVLRPPVPAFTTLDPAHTASGLTLSPGNLTITETSATDAQLTSRSLSSHSTGKFYHEATVNGGGFYTLGYVNAAFLGGTWPAGLRCRKPILSGTDSSGAIRLNGGGVHRQLVGLAGDQHCRFCG